ncbi:MAG: type II CAAX endopeptidase family protein [Terracidiphilus sp.]|jgi:membrane protease YdiL (CAAX protease family)
MSTLPDHDRLGAQDEVAREAESSTDTFGQTDLSEISAPDPQLPNDAARYDEADVDGFGESPQAGYVAAEPLVFPPSTTDDESHSGESVRLFSSWDEPQIPHIVRIPNFGHLLILAVLVVFGWICAGLLTLGALHFNLFGVSTIQKAETDIHYTLGSMIAVYLVAFIAAIVVFPMLWGKSFFAGVQWNGENALRLRGRLFGAAFICFLFAIVNGLLMPGPENAPIDKIFRAPGAAWLLFAFGITAAPFFEEILFRGFLLPALCSAFDWASEKIHGENPPALEENGHPHWSFAAMATSSVLTSIPFALMHAEQTGYSLGPFVLLVCVSLVLCWARLSTRSLAASVLVHASYNCLLFSFMLLGTSGFQHLDKM